MLRARQTKVFHPRHMDQLFIISTFWAVRKPNKTNQNICLELLEFRWEILELFAFSDAAVLSDKWFFPICLRLWIIHGISFYHAYNIFSATTTTGGLVIFFCASAQELNYAWIIYANCVLIWIVVSLKMYRKWRSIERGFTFVLQFFM